jgi:hypothetical protein
MGNLVPPLYNTTGSLVRDIQSQRRRFYNDVDAEPSSSAHWLRLGVLSIPRTIVALTRYHLVSVHWTFLLPLF